MPSLTLDDFAALQGDLFALQLEGAEVLWAELVEAQPLAAAPFNGRQPFSLMFAGPAAPVLPQRTYRMAHERLPELDIFLVPVGADASGVRYQAVFS
jgi:hypothetical protein